MAWEPPSDGGVGAAALLSAYGGWCALEMVWACLFRRAARRRRSYTPTLTLAPVLTPRAACGVLLLAVHPEGGMYTERWED